MAIVLEANYSKKLGLPGYSSHQYMVSVQTELTDLEQVPEASGRLYRLLQDSVDEEIRAAGWLPGAEEEPPPQLNGNGTTQGQNGNGHWKCSDKQQDLIRKIILENELDLQTLQELAHQRFGKTLQSLNKLEASGFLSELLDTYSGRNNGHRNGSGNGNGNGRKNGAYAGGRR